MNIVLKFFFTFLIVSVIIFGFNIHKSEAAFDDPTNTPVPAITDAVDTGTPCDETNGDANCDGVTNMVDYLYYVRYVAGVRTFPANVNLDVNKSGGIDDNDRCVIVRGITGNTNTCNSNT
jgi:hypothetical protein